MFNFFKQYYSMKVSRDVLETKASIYKTIEDVHTLCVLSFFSVAQPKNSNTNPCSTLTANQYQTYTQLVILLFAQHCFA